MTADGIKTPLKPSAPESNPLPFYIPFLTETVPLPHRLLSIVLKKRAYYASGGAQRFWKLCRNCACFAELRSSHLNKASWFLSQIKAEPRVCFCFILLFTSSSPCRMDQFAVYYFFKHKCSTRRTPSLIIDPRQLATESYERGLKPRNVTTTEQTNKHTSFLPLSAIRTELSSDKINNNDTIIYI